MFHHQQQQHRFSFLFSIYLLVIEWIQLTLFILFCCSFILFAYIPVILSIKKKIHSANMQILFWFTQHWCFEIFFFCNIDFRLFCSPFQIFGNIFFFLSGYPKRMLILHLNKKKFSFFYWNNQKKKKVCFALSVKK